MMIKLVLALQLILLTLTVSGQEKDIFHPGLVDGSSTFNRGLIAL